MHFKLGNASTALISIITLISLALLPLSPSEFSIGFAVISLVVFFTCSRSNAFSRHKDVAWLVSLTSVIVTIASTIIMFIIFIIMLLLHIVIRTPAPRFRLWR